MTLPNWLHHYTSQAGFKGILTTRTLRATKIQYLNDAREFSLALDMTAVEIGARLGRSPSSRTTDYLKTLKSDLSRVPLVNIHVCSLTERPDQLSQWRGYCRPGDGLSIGFPRTTLSQLALAAGWSLVQCVYGQREQQALIRSLLDGAIAKLTAAIDKHSWRTVQQLVALAPKLKHSGFAEEREWRLVSPPIDARNPEYDFRPGKHALIPFVPFHLAHPKTKLPAVNVVVGPTGHPILSQGSAATLLALNAESYSITSSVIPFRDW
jgi:hypothetical protein